MSSGIVAAASDEMQLWCAVQQFSLGCCTIFKPALLCRAAPWMSVALLITITTPESSYLRPAHQNKAPQASAFVSLALAAF